MSEGAWQKATSKKSKHKNDKPNTKKDFKVQGVKPLDDVSNTAVDRAKPAGKSQPKRKPKKQVEKVQYDFKDIKEALASDVLSDLNQQIESIKERSTNTNVVCKEIAFYMDGKVRCPNETLTEDKHEVDFPLCKMEKKAYSALCKLYSKDLEKDLVSHIYQIYLNSMVENLKKDKPVWGHKLCIQAIAHTHPKLCSADLQTFLPKVQNLQNFPPVCLSLLWGLGQCGTRDQSCGMEVWLELMLPSLGLKNMAPYCMSYVEGVMRRDDKKDIAFKPDHFLEIANWRFDAAPKASNKSNPTRERMKGVYSDFRDALTRTKRSKSNFFAAILEKTVVDESPEYRRELTELAIQCLRTDAHCFSKWRELYTHNLPRTKLILNHFDENWDETVDGMPRTALAETVRAFKNTNADIAARSDPVTSKPEFHDVRMKCDVLNERLSCSRGSPRSSKTLLFCLLGLFLLCAGFVAYDVTTSGGAWQRTRSYSFLKSKGILTVTSHLSRKLSQAAEAAYLFFSTEVYPFLSGLADAMSPYVDKIKATALRLGSDLWRITEPIRDYGSVAAALVAEKLIAGAKYVLQALDKLIDLAYPALVFLKDRLMNVYDGVLALASGEMTWTAAYERVTAAFVYASEQCVFYFQQALAAISNYVAPETP